MRKAEECVLQQRKLKRVVLTYQNEVEGCVPSLLNSTQVR